MLYLASIECTYFVWNPMEPCNVGHWPKDMKVYASTKKIWNGLYKLMSLSKLMMRINVENPNFEYAIGASKIKGN